MNWLSQALQPVLDQLDSMGSGSEAYWIPVGLIALAVVWVIKEYIVAGRL